VSDPGFRLVDAAVGAGIRVTCVPGPSAVLMALAVSGLPVDRFCFEGFLPRKPGERARTLQGLADERRTMVFFEAPHRIDTSLAAMADAFGPDRPAAVCRELTKTYEEFRRGTLADLAAHYQQVENVKGEIVLVIGPPEPVETSEADVEAVLADLSKSMPTAGAATEAARLTGLPRKVLYQRLLEIKNADGR
jgi:16S rRNA (cytidine1402-2'-O)-methyltransferase